jgi:hypothetical protein
VRAESISFAGFITISFPGLRGRCRRVLLKSWQFGAGRKYTSRRGWLGLYSGAVSGEGGRRTGMNKPVVFLRIASVLTLIHSVLHTVGGVFGGVDPGAASVAAAAMKANQFLLMGSMRTFWDFHIGMGLAVTIFLTGESVLMWQLSSMAKTDARRLRPMMATLLAIYLAFAVNSYIYFFFMPVVVEIIIAACLGVAILTAKAKDA